MSRSTIALANWWARVTAKQFAPALDSCKPRPQPSRKVGAVLRRLYRQNQRCAWCGTATSLPPRPTPPGRRAPKTEATIDHLYSRPDPRRAQLPSGWINAVVLACRGCNTARSHRDPALA